MRRRLSLAAKALAAASLMAFCGTCDHLSQFIQSFGYTELRPPSTLFPPGTLVAIKRHDPFEAKIICTAEESLGPELKPIRSRTARSSLVAGRSLGFKLNAQVLDQFKTDNRYENISSLNVSLDNSEILTLKDSDIGRYARFRSRECQAAVDKRLSKGDDVTMISSVIVGDMVMKAQWKEDVKMDGSAKVAALQHLALEYGLDAGATNESMVSAKGLIWGVVDDLFLAAQTIEAMDEGAYARGQKALAINFARTVAHPRGGISLVEHPPFRPSQRHPAPLRGHARVRARDAAPAAMMDTQQEIEFEDEGPLPMLGREASISAAEGIVAVDGSPPKSAAAPVLPMMPFSFAATALTPPSLPATSAPAVSEQARVVWFSGEVPRSVPAATSKD